MTGSPETTRRKTKNSPFPWQHLAVFIILSSGLFALSQVTYNSLKRTVRDCAESELIALVGMKATQITEWRKDWLNLANLYFENTHFIDRIRQIITNPDADHIKKALLDNLSTLRQNFPFERVLLHLPRGKTVLAYPEDATPDLNPGVVDLVHKAWQTHTVEFGDIYLDEESKRPGLSLVIPLFVERQKDKEPVAFLTFDIDPQQKLYPFLSATEESQSSPKILLIRREGNDFILLNEPTGTSAPPLSLRIPVGSFRRVHGQTALGEEGIVEGTDLRGLPAVAAIKAVPKTPWLLLAMTDMQELYGDLNRKRLFLLGSAAFLILVSGVILGLIWRHECVAFKAAEGKRWGQANASMFDFLRHIIDIMPNPAFFKDTQGRYQGCNAAFERALGFHKEKILNKTVKEVAPPEISADHEKVDAELLAQPGYRIYESTMKAYDGDHHVIFIKTTYTQPDGTVGGILGILKDITQRKRAEEELDQLRKFSDGTIQTMTEGLVLTDSEGKFAFVNPAAAAMLGYAPGDLLDKEAKTFVSQKDHRLVDEANERRVQGLSDRYEIDFIHKDGSYRTILVSGGPRVRGTQLGGTLAVLTDITERKRMEEEIRSLSLTDELTKLYNRRGFVTLSEQQLKTAARMKKKIVLIYMDVDNLKMINDTGGHLSGDKALADIALLLKKNFRDSDIVGRLGGDEFAVLAMETTRMKPEILTRRLEEKISIYNASVDTETGFKISLSWGIVAQDPEFPILLDEMISRADELMFKQKRDKKAGRRP